MAPTCTDLTPCFAPFPSVGLPALSTPSSSAYVVSFQVTRYTPFKSRSSCRQVREVSYLHEDEVQALSERASKA